MDAWDKFTTILQENNMQNYLNQIYKHKHLATANAHNITRIIRETAEEWLFNHSEHEENNK